VPIGIRSGPARGFSHEFREVLLAQPLDLDQEDDVQLLTDKGPSSAPSRGRQHAWP
jgi:hypothetical protein